MQLNGNMKVVQGYFNDPQSNELFSVDVAGSTGAPVAYWGFGTGGGTVASWARTTFSGSAPTTILGHLLFDAYGEKVGEIGDPSIPIDELPQVWSGMRRDTKLDLYTAGDGKWYKSSLGMYLPQANPSDFVNPYRFAAGDPANRGTSWGGSSEPSMLWRFSLGLFLDDTIQVARNTGHLSGLERAYVVGGFFLADMIGVRGLSDAFSQHDAAHGHVQSGFERGMDGVFGAVGIGMTAVGLPGAGKAGGIIGKVGSKAAANTVDNVAIEAAEKIAARSMTKAEWKVYNIGRPCFRFSRLIPLSPFLCLLSFTSDPPRTD